MNKKTEDLLYEAQNVSMIPLTNYRMIAIIKTNYIFTFEYIS